MEGKGQINKMKLVSHYTTVQLQVKNVLTATTSIKYLTYTIFRKKALSDIKVDQKHLQNTYRFTVTYLTHFHMPLKLFMITINITTKDLSDPQ